MLERIREGSQGIVAKTILGLVIITFAVSGIGSYINSKADLALAKVNGVEIGQSAFDQAYNVERNRMQQQFGQMFEQLMADENYVDNFRKGILDRLVVEELQKQQAGELGVRIGDEQIRDAIRTMPEFQVNGQFDNNRYTALLRQNNFQPAQFRELMRQQMSRGQYVGAILSSEFVLPSETARLATLNNQTRSFDLVTISAEKQKSLVTIEQSDLENFYQGNKSRYMTQEQAAVEYLLIDKKLLTEQLTVSDDELDSYYQDNLAAYTRAERRRVSHILVEFADDKSAAKTQIDAILARVNAGEDFAELAKTESQDTFSGENGGDLEWLNKGDMDPSFDEAAFELANVGDVTGVVESEFGYHLIKLTDVEAEAVKTFAEVQADIKQTLLDDKANEVYVDVQTRAMEMAFEVPDTLADAATEAELNLLSSELVSRAQLPAELNDPQIITKIFDQAFIDEGLNSDLIEINDERSVIIRVNDYKAAEQKSLEMVKAQVENSVRQQKSRVMALEKANEMLVKAKQGESLATLTSDMERKENLDRFSNEVNPQVRNALFAMAKPAQGSNELTLVEMANGDAAIISLYQVGAKQDETDLTAQMASIVNQISNRAYIEALRSVAEIEITM